MASEAIIALGHEAAESWDLDQRREAVQEMLAEYARLAAEVERLRPLAAIGEAVGRLPPYIGVMHLLPNWCVEGRAEGPLRGYGPTLAAALRDAGLMEVNGRRGSDRRAGGDDRGPVGRV
jgi:hypothetical protein